MKLRLYICVQVLLVCCYLVFRFTNRSRTGTLYDYETKTGAVLILVAVIRLFQLDSWWGFGISMLKMLHVAIFGVMVMFSIVPAILFGFCAVLVDFGVEPPCFQVSDRVATLNKDLFQSYIDVVPECFILFYTTWESRCISVMPVFSKLADKYGTENRLFARFNVGKVGSGKAEKDYQVSISDGSMGHLPTIVRYKDGKEIKRLNPAVARENTLNMLNTPGISKFFNLGNTSK
jgi:thiol-disulfide isomerase/thioredoxin